MMKTITIAIPCYEQLEIGKTSLFCFDQLTSPDVKCLLIDNGSKQDYETFTQRSLSKKWRYVRNEKNEGVLLALQQAYHACDTDILIVTHNDVWIYRAYWDKIIGNLFEDIPKLGGVGLFGGKGCGNEGHRLDTFGSLIEMHGHGRKLTMPWEPACVFDGFFMAYSMEMLKQTKFTWVGGSYEEATRLGGSSGCQYGGFDQCYQMHHIYDLDSSLVSIYNGYKNIVANIPCHHLSGLTANNEAYNQVGPTVHQANSALFFEKWKGKLGVSVDEEFNYRWGQ